MALLALNDHVFKARFANWWTGKLSDFAGLYAIAVLLSVVMGTRKAAVASTVGFIALKTVPAVAEMSAPLLGGVTRTDPTDLIALAVLVPIWFSNGSSPRTRPTGKPSRQDRPVTADRSARARSALSVAVSILGAGAAVLTATATSCSMKPTVVEVIADGDTFYAAVIDGSGHNQWARSDDGGISWSKYTGPEPRGASGSTILPYEDPGPTGPSEACSPDGTCWRIRDREVIEMKAPGGAWTEQRRLSDAERSSITTGCAGSHVGLLSSIAVSDSTPGDHDTQVVASLGAGGVLVREPDGTWSRHGVLGVSSRAIPKPSALDRTLFDVVIVSGPVAAVALWVLGRRRLGTPWLGVLTVIVGWLATFTIMGMIGIVVGTGRYVNDLRVAAWSGLVLMVGVVAVAILIARPPRYSRLPDPPRVLPPG